MRKRDLITAAIVSFALVLPFAILELLNTTFTPENRFGVALLFVVLYVVPFVAVALLAPVVRTLRSEGLAAIRIGVVLRAVCAIVLALAWTGMIADQWPCFIGVPNCD